MSYIKNILSAIGLVVLLAAIGCLLWLFVHHTSVSDSRTRQEVASVNTTIADNGMTFEIATSSAAQQLGLGGRAVIPDNYAMLFVFPADGTYGFWMKDMLAPIDMVWLTDNGTIASITPSAQPSSYPNVFYPPSPIRYVLETRAGFSIEKGWHVGSVILLPQSVMTDDPPPVIVPNLPS